MASRERDFLPIHWLTREQFEATYPRHNTQQRIINERRTILVERMARGDA